jgi:hypothetical protein
MIVEGLVLGHDTVDVEVFGVGEGIGLELRLGRRRRPRRSEDWELRKSEGEKVRGQMIGDNRSIWGTELLNRLSKSRGGEGGGTPLGL